MSSYQDIFESLQQVQKRSLAQLSEGGSGAVVGLDGREGGRRAGEGGQPQASAEGRGLGRVGGGGAGSNGEAEPEAERLRSRAAAAQASSGPRHTGAASSPIDLTQDSPAVRRQLPASMLPRTASVQDAAAAQHPRSRRASQQQKRSAERSQSDATSADGSDARQRPPAGAAAVAQEAAARPQQGKRLPASMVAIAHRMQEVGADAARPASTAPDASASAQATQEAMRAAFEAMSATSDEEATPPPRTLTLGLMRHQRLALAWMCSREDGCPPLGGILADDQGLGKTVTTTALIVTRPPPQQTLWSGRGATHATVRPVMAPSAMDAGCSNGCAAAAASSPSAAGSPNVEALEGDSSGATAAEAAAEEQQSASAELELVDEDVATQGDDDVAVQGDSGSASDAEDAPAASGRPQGGTLVVCPTTVLHQWERELKSKVHPSVGLTLCCYHGKSKLPDPFLLASYSVVFTTYSTLTMEAPKKQAQRTKTSPPAEEAKPGRSDEAPPAAAAEAAGADRAGGDAGRASTPWSHGPLFQVMWWRVVLDEAQTVKNARTRGAAACWALRARRRWCLTGTPLQNSIDDLYSYFHFLRYEPYCRASSFKTLVKDPIQMRPEIGFRRLKAILQGVLLRRTKKSCIDGVPIVELPAREEKSAWVEFSPQEAQLYHQLHEESKARIQAAEAQGLSAGERYVGMLWHLLRLRQACNHPWLVKRSPCRALLGRPAAAQLAACRRLPQPLRQQLLHLLEKAAAPCAACGDLPDDAVATTCCHVYCRQCVAGQQGDADGGERAFSCCSCGMPVAPGDVHTLSALRLVEGVSGDAPGAGAEVPLQQREWIASAKVERLLHLLLALRGRGSVGTPAAVGGAAAPSAAPAPKKARLVRAANKMDMLLAKRRPMQMRPAHRPGSAPHPGSAAAACKEKVVVFSQWTSMLDVLQLPLQRHQISFTRLDGTMSIANREKAIRDFTERADVMVMLVSLKAAALGLNLTVANHVVLMDLWWNPATEEQAIDRAHRIGQTRDVHITRIVVKGTVEERILQLQDQKRKLVAAAFGEGSVSEANRLSMEDLRFLFQHL